jgi:hypothetical protein
MRKHFLLAGLVAAVLAVAAPAKADTILFDPTGTGAGFIAIDGFDWAVGNGIVVGASATSDEGDEFTLYYQANLAGAVDAEGNEVFDNGDGGDFFTVVLGIGERIAEADTTDEGIGQLTFELNEDSDVNFFRIYSTDALGSNTTGVCFVCGEVILEGVVLADGFLSSFDTTGLSGGNLDQAGGNDYPGVSTIEGSGDSNLTIQITSYNPSYFQGIGGASLQFATNDANAAVPYNTANPSACFHATAIIGPITDPTSCVGGVTEGVSTVGAVNFISGPNGMLEIDGNSAFQAGGVVPEPATLTLLGFGLLGGAAARRRQLRRKQ